MEIIDLDFLINWSRTSGLVLRAEYPLSLSFSTLRAEEAVVDLQGRQNSDLVLLANRVVEMVNNFGDSPAICKSYLIWIRERGISNDIHELVAKEEFASLLRGFGQQTNVEGLVINAEDAVQATIFTLFVMSFSWDAYVASMSGNILIHIHHDGYLKVYCRYLDKQAYVRDCLEAWLHPNRLELT